MLGDPYFSAFFSIMVWIKLRTWLVVMLKLKLKPAVVSLFPIVVCLFCSCYFVYVCFLCCVFDFLGGKKKEVKKETGLGLVNRKDENFGEWYSEVWFSCFNGFH